jgi:hypothetical protein
MGLIQTESVCFAVVVHLDIYSPENLLEFTQPYFQPKPAVPTPFRINSAYHDPSPYEGNASSWALAVQDSQAILIFGVSSCKKLSHVLLEHDHCFAGAGLYSFFVVSIVSDWHQ